MFLNIKVYEFQKFCGRKKNNKQKYKDRKKNKKKQKSLG